MPSWGEILKELGDSAAGNGGSPDFDGVRRKYLRQLHELTGRSVVIYATNWMSGAAPAQLTSITLKDMHGLMEVFHQLPGPNLDLVLHSPGGQAEATERLVGYMRSKFSHVRVIVPLAAMSAATMWAMAADEVVMGKHSQLGPIDPQIGLPSGLSMPAGALTDQFRDAKEELASSPEKITAWLPILQQYPPGLLNFCESTTKLSRVLVGRWLQDYMFEGMPDAAARADLIAAWLADDKSHLSHSRPLTREMLADKGVRIVKLEADVDLQDTVLSVFHATELTWATGTTKIIENHMGRAFVQSGGPAGVFVMNDPSGQGATPDGDEAVSEISEPPLPEVSPPG